MRRPATSLFAHFQVHSGVRTDATVAAKYHDNPRDSLLAVFEFVPIGNGRKLAAISLLEGNVRGSRRVM